MTRVAKLNADMWTELFLDNVDNLTEELDGLIENLQQYSRALHEKDAKTLHALLKAGSDRKEKSTGNTATDRGVCYANRKSAGKHGLYHLY